MTIIEIQTVRRAITLLRSQIDERQPAIESCSSE
jgi:hypothetical protein